MPPGRIEVFCRVRPTDKLCSAQVHLLPDNVSVQITRPARTGNNNNNNNNSGEGSAGRSKMEEHGENVEVDSTGNTLISNYTFDGVLSGNAATQENVFKTTTAKMVESGVMNGSNATLLSYGQRGSGKTYTIFGGTDYRSRGIAPRVIHHLFTAMADMKNDRSYKVSMTFLQLNGEQVSDLLAGQPPAGGKVSLSQQNKAEKPVVSIDGKGEVLLRGIIKRPCESESDALAALFEGLQNHRAQQQVGFRPAHLALTLYVAHQSLTESESETRHGCFHMVDLAGAQRVDGLTDPIAKTEAQQINKSLSMLEQVVIALSNSSTSSMEGDTDNAKVQHIPYRQSKLTTLLKGSMGGHSLTTLIAHIFPEKQFVDATVATLNFAKRMMRVSTDPRVNVIVDTGAQMRSLQRQLTDLRAELRLQGQLNAKSSGGGVGGASGARGSLTAGSASSLGVDELQVIHDKVHAFVDGNNATIQITDVREMHACFAFMRNMVEQKDLRINELKSQVSSAMTTAHAQGGGGGTGGSSGGYSSSAGEGGGAGQGGGAASAGNARGGRGAASKRSSMSRRNSNIPPAEKVDTFTPSVLDKNSGVGYGTSAKPSQVLPENRDAMQPVSSVGNGAPAGTAAKPSWDAPTTYHPGKSGEELQPNAVGKSALKGFTGGNVPPLQPTRPGTILATGGAAPPNLGAPTFGVGSLGNAAAGQTTFVGSPGVPPTMAAAASAVAAGRFQKPNPTTPLTALPPAAATTNSTSARGRPNAPTLVQVAPAPPPQPLPPATSHSQRSARPPLGPQRGGSSHDMVSTTTSMLLSRQQQGTTGDAGKGVAFEDYKRTPSGALQVRAMNEDQQQLMSVQERIGSLERRLQGLSTVIGYQRGSVSGGGGVGFTHTTTSSHAMGDELGTGGTPAPRGSQSDDGAPHMTPVQAVAYSHSLQDNLGKAKSEQAHLVKQIERRRMAFLQNFDEWYIQLGGIVDDAYGGDYGAEGFPRIRAVDGPAHAGGMRESMKYLLTDPDANPEALQGLMDINGDKFLDAAERFDAMELNRQIAQDPDSAAFFNAKKLIEVRSRSGKGRRGH